MIGGGPQEGNVVVLAGATGERAGEGSKAQGEQDVQDEEDEDDGAHRGQAHRAGPAEQPLY